ncbi:hypothetical protein B0A49_03129 [Cryomyces minteri]|uniref:Ubiquitin-conjugating enzyme E2 Z n=1 Tax=Cryomyces minteri TaxID=331657 RepID=A0A4U0X9M1_9PEZI|nr:hypothetical protein B0A49_03129 [Cryomyces minteri]
MANSSILRITRELNDIRKGSDLSIAVACRDIDVRHVKALIVGPPDTPYEFGFFEFDVRFPKEYPTKAPHVNATTTNGGRCRFNPNIYAQGKVCLSILGTWRGEPGEEWSTAQGLESILISIQSLMSSNPYENEPGFEDANSVDDKILQKAYVAKIRHETLRISVIQRLEEWLKIPFISTNGTTCEAAAPEQPQSYEVYEYDAERDYRESAEDYLFDPFKDLCKQRFLWYYDSYMLAIEKASKLDKDGTKFTQMVFEGGGNSMDGKFHYTQLKRRLGVIRERLDAETKSWAEEGKTLAQKNSSLAVNLLGRFEQIVAAYKQNSSAMVEVELVDGNPFVWQLTLFGKPMTNLDGGLFKVRMCISPRYPDEQPRVTVETPLFHQRVSKDGVLCYVPQQPDDAQSHIEAIVTAIEDESPRYDPRTLVNPEAAQLLWGSAQDKKLYNRKMRRSAQDSVD